MKNTVYLVYDRRDPYELPLAVLDSRAALARWLGFPYASKKDRKRLDNAITFGSCYPNYGIELITLSPPRIVLAS